MFRKNEEHKQQRFFTLIDQLPDKMKKRLEKSWAHVFYHEYFCLLDESGFSKLYSKKKSRPNIPVNILVGFETLKCGFGMSDEDLYEQFLFNLQYRYALGLYNFDEGNFDIRSLYNFREMVGNYAREHGVNLIREATEKVTDEQIERFEIKTGLQRMDSTMVQSNIRKMSRLQLLVEIVHRLYRMLEEKEQKAHEELFHPYIQTDSLHYCYKVKGQEVESRMEQIGKDLAHMLELFSERYGENSVYQKAHRVFHEHFRFEENEMVIRETKELNGGCLQSPDDEEATFRRKSGEASRGYVANITETCDEENQLQVITSVSVAPNITDDQELLASDIETIKGRMDIDTVYNDAGYSGAIAAEAAENHNVEQKVSAIKGRKRKDPEALGLEDFTVIRDNEGTLHEVTCPQGHTGELRSSPKEDRFTLGFDGDICNMCPMEEQCPVKKLKKKNRCVLRFSQKDLRVSEQRKQVANSGNEVLNKRASVESTVRSVIRPFGGHLCKMPVRGAHRITTMTVLSAAMVNIRRITGYLFPKKLSVRKKASLAFT